MAGSHQICTFTVDGLLLGLDVLEVQEVIRYQELTRVPRAPAVVRGLINLRGQIVTAIDLRRRIGLPPAPEGDRPMNVVVRTDEGAVSLLVDAIGDVLEVEADAFERAPETVPSTIRDLLCGIYQLKHRLLLLLDARRIAEVAEVTRPDPGTRAPEPRRSAAMERLRTSR